MIRTGNSNDQLHPKKGSKGFVVTGESSNNMTMLPEDFTPGEFDVICGRGRTTFNHPGNAAFRNVIKDYLPSYSNAESKSDKSIILCDIIEQVREGSPNGGFVKKDTKSGRWYEVSLEACVGSRMCGNYVSCGNPIQHVRLIQVLLKLHLLINALHFVFCLDA